MWFKQAMTTKSSAIAGGKKKREARKELRMQASLEDNAEDFKPALKQKLVEKFGKDRDIGIIVGPENNKNNEAFLFGSTINPLKQASTHVAADPMRNRKLLLKRKEIV